MHVTRVIIHGRVQGVGYRAWTSAAARKLGLTGWVRNRSDGTVEAVFAGDAATVEHMIAACRKGPMLAKVQHIEQFAETETTNLKEFAQRETM